MPSADGIMNWFYVVSPGYVHSLHSSRNAGCRLRCGHYVKIMTDHTLQVLAPSDLAPARSARLALLSNPGSGRNGDGGAAIHRLLDDYPHATWETAGTPEEIAGALHRLANQEPEVLIVNGGDGTVAAVLTALFNERPFERLPLLALLAGGTTNMTAADAGMKGGARRALCRLLAWARRPDPNVTVVQRPILRVRPGRGTAPLYGMFFGTGAIIKGIEFCHQKILRRGLRDGFGPGLCLLRILFALLRGDRRYVAPVPVQVTTRPALQRQDDEREYFILLASTLERLFLGLRPYWGRCDGGLYYSAIGADPRHPLRAIPPLFWGRPGRHATPENGYWSSKLQELVLELDGTFTIDGELYPLQRVQGPLRVSHTMPLTFLRF